MISGIFHCIERNEIVGHYSTAAIYRTLLFERCELQTVYKMNAVDVREFALVKAVDDVLVIILAVTLLVRLLDASS